MSKQVLISIGREFGSGGHLIGEILSKKLDLPLYDNNLLREITTKKNLDHAELERYDELPKLPFFSRTIRGFSNSPEENIANLQFEYIKTLAGSGESFIIVGRCGEAVLKDFDCLISIFINADLEAKVDKISKEHNLSRTEAELMIKQRNSARKAYHNYYCTDKWGDSRHYDISLNSTRLGIEGSAELLEAYIRARMALM